MRRLILLLAGVLAIFPVLALAALPESAAVARGAAFIRTTQQADGGFGGFGDGQTFDAIYALRSAGIDPATVTTGGKSPADFLRTKAASQDKPANAAKAALAAVAMNLDPRNVSGTDLVSRVEAGYNATTGRYGADDFTQSVAVLGLVCTGNAAPNRAILALRTSQLADGGWGFEGASDPDTAAVAAQALVAAGIPASDATLTKALTYFKKTQAADAGWGFDPTSGNASSTAFVVQALLALGENVESAAYRKGAATPVSFLVSQQEADGSFKGFDPGFAANQVLPALAGRTFCNAPRTVVHAAPPTAPPAVTATPARPTAPLPPNTGSGYAHRDGTMLVLAGLVLMIVGASAVRLRRRS